MGLIFEKSIVSKKSSVSGQTVPHLKEVYNGATQHSEIFNLPIAKAYKLAVSSQQIRQSGITSKHVNDLLGSFERVGQQWPICILSDSDTVIETIFSGIHRIEAMYNLWRKASAQNKHKYEFINAYECPWQFTSDEERDLYKLRLNDVLPSRDNDIGDYVAHINRHVPAPKGISHSSKKQNDHMVRVKTYCKKQFSNMHHKTQNKIVNAVLKGVKNSKLHNFTSARVLQDIKRHCKAGSFSFNWRGTKAGEWDNNVIVYPVPRLTQINGPNTFGNIYNKMCLYEGAPITFLQKEFVVVLWDCDTLGKSDKDIDKSRQAMLDAINKRNIPWFLKGSSLQRFVTRVIIAPQKATGKHKENQLVFKECPVSSDGEFTLDGLKNGWKK